MASSILKVIHSDICGSMNVMTQHGAYYFIIFVKDYTWLGFVYSVSRKLEALDCFICFLNLVRAKGITNMFALYVCFMCDLIRVTWE